MEKLTFDTGVRSYRINGEGILRFNPADPNVYARFLEAADQIRAAEQTLTAAADPLQAMTELDRKVKSLLSGVFGAGNDFDRILGGVNLLAVAANGERVVTNLLRALQPVLTEGAQLCAGRQASLAVDKANARRAAIT